MTTYTIQATGDIPYEFECDRDPQEWSARHVQGRERNRYHEVSIWDLNDSLIAFVEYKTFWQGEVDHSKILEAATAGELFDLMKSLNPIAYLNGYPKSEHFAAKQKELERQITDDWQYLLMEISKDLGIKKIRGQKFSSTVWNIPCQIFADLEKIAGDRETTVGDILSDLAINYIEENL